MRKNFSKPVSIDETLKNSRLYVDTNVWLHMAFMASLIRRLARINVPLYVLAYVIKELKKAACSEDKALQESAKRALKTIDSLVKQGLCVIDDCDYGALEIGDAPFHAAFDRLRFVENIVFLTRDNNNAYDTLMLNYRRSAKSWRKIQCWAIEDNGFIDTTFYQKRFSFPTFNHPSKESHAIPKPVTKTVEPIEEFYCRDCGKMFTMTASHQRYFKLKGLEVPRRCPECIAKRKAEGVKPVEKPMVSSSSSNGSSSSSSCCGGGGSSGGFFYNLGSCLGSLGILI